MVNIVRLVNCYWIPVFHLFTIGCQLFRVNDDKYFMNDVVSQCGELME